MKVRFQTDEGIKTIPSQQRQRELIAINILRTLKGFLQAEEKHGWMQTMAWEIGLCSQTQSGAGELSKGGRGAGSSLLPVCGVCWTRATPIHLHSVRDCFCVRITELSCDGDLIWHLREKKKRPSLITENEKQRP